MEWKVGKDMWEMPILWTDFFHLFYYFMIYSFLGWCMETCLVSFRNREFVNRGFMNGPFCPIYGTGASAIYLFLTPIQEYPWLVFLGGLILATVIEYFSSWIMERLFHARWWDYSERKYNFQGRVCLLVSFYWGILSLVMVYVFQPIILVLVDRIPRFSGKILGTAMMIYFVVDLSITVKHVLKLNEKLAVLTRIRSDFMNRVEASMLYSTAEEARTRLEVLSSSEILEEVSERIANRVGAGRDNLLQFKEKMERLMQELKVLTEEKRSNLGIKNAVEKRLLRAFPHFKPSGNLNALEELKRNWFETK